MNVARVPSLAALAVAVAARAPTVASAAVPLAVAGSAAILVVSDANVAAPYLGSHPHSPADYFRPFFGGIPPMLGIATVAAFGVVALARLSSRGWFPIHESMASARGFCLAATIGGALAWGMVLAEMTGVVRSPADMNVPPPYAILFYPVIGYVAEIVFHVLPLALLLPLLGPLTRAPTISRWLSHAGLVWLSIVGVAFLEPVYQVSFEASLSWQAAYVGLTVYLVNFAQLSIFRRYGFASMYALRLVYYLIWHIVWGYLRLQ